MNNKNRILFLLLYVVIAGCSTAQPKTPDSLLTRLQEGGYVIFFRHGSTDHSQKDTDLNNPMNCEAQRQLDDKGREQSRMIGQAFKASAIPVGDIITSHYCRCIDTARIAFGRATPSMDITSIQGVTLQVRQQRISNIRKALNTPPKPGTNTILVSHNIMFKEAAGHLLTEGEGAIFKPQKNAVVAKFIRQVKPEEWKQLK